MSQSSKFTVFFFILRNSDEKEREGERENHKVKNKQRQNSLSFVTFFMSMNATYAMFEI